MTSKWLRLLAALLAFALFAAACGSDGDDEDTDDDTSGETDSGSSSEPADDDTDADADGEDGDDAMADGDALATEGAVEIATGTTLDLDACPDDWSATTGVDGDEIRIGQSLPQSGQLAAFGQIGEGMEMYFDYVNAKDPIDGKELVLITADDGYEAGRTVANVEEMLDTEDIFAFAHIIGTPNNLAARPVTDDNCIPQLFNSTGFPLWGDPANFPWTMGNILNYATETEFWCQAVIDEFGEGATVAALYMNNDFGTTYQNTANSSEICSSLDIVEEQLHDPAAPDIQNEMTTLISTDADVLFLGTTAAFCPQTVGVLAGSDWRPRTFMSYTCNNLASFFTPVQDAAGLLASEDGGIRMMNSNKVCGDPTWDGDEAVELTKQVLDEFGGVTCADGSFSTGVLYGQLMEDVLRRAAEMPGGLNRVNLMAAVWNLDSSNPNYLGGTLRLDGTNDAYLTEAAQVQEVQVVDGNLTFVGIGDVIDLEGQAGSFEG